VIHPAVLLADLKKQVASLENDLRERASDVTEFDTALRSEWQAARTAQRIAAPYESWLEGQVTQSAVAWVLGTVFLRFCEDNLLIDLPWLAGPGERLDIAKERQQAFFEDPSNRELTDREWIVDGFQAMSKASPVAAGLFDAAHNPMWQITPSLEASKALIAFWRTVSEAAVTEDNENGLVHNFTDPTWNTRFLGDLYQHLSEHAKKTYALLQTPEFVEEFILDLTLDPAIDEFGLDPEPPTANPDELNLPRGLRLIDPTCGSGHFLLGAFHRLLKRWEQQAPGVDRWELINRVLYSVHGVDKNPFAVSIARFRLFLAALRVGGTKRLADAPDFVINIAIGDSLLHGRGAPQLDQGKMEISADGELLDDEPFMYSTEDISDYRKTVDLLGIGSYHVVVGNPPYITVKDKQENDNYRVYKSCSGSYALTVPFAERFFQLAIRGGQDKSGSGHVGQITANSFMKREFGKKLIQEFFPTIELTHVIDTSGAYIPDHGTPTVILIGRRTWPRDKPIRAALSVRGEPKQPDDAAQGLVWRAIVEQTVKHVGTDSEWISVTDLARNQLRSHPWSLSGGGASDVMQAIEAKATKILSDMITEIGFGAVTREDSAYMIGAGALRRHRIPICFQRAIVEGEVTRDWAISDPIDSVWPYNDVTLQAEESSAVNQLLWPFRAPLRDRVAYGSTQLERGLTWFEYSMFFSRRYAVPLSITFAEVATHNHFVLDRGGNVFKQTAPVIKLPESATEDDHVALLGVLNSSAVCFWLKESCFPKGGSGVGRGIQSEDWMERYAFNSTNVEKVPLPVNKPFDIGQEIDMLGRQLEVLEPSSVCTESVPSRDLLRAAEARHSYIRGRIIALQEELDWEVYRLYALISAQEAIELRLDPDSLPALKLGERAFEILLARKVADKEVTTQWFTRHSSTSITDLPVHWPEAYKRVVEKRIEIIEKRPQGIGLIERPECKRRWASEPWEKKEKAALRNWLLDRCENRDLWFAPDDTGNVQPKLMTINRLADRLRDDADFVSVARLYAGEDAELAAVLAEILDAEHVPYIAALRYKDSGLRNRAQWEKTWELQREEDATGKRLDIPVPPKYKGADFLKQSYWSNRGKLDVPKERFISYPGASPDGDGSLLLGWAGWDHREQAHALMTLIEERSTRDGWEKDRLIPLIAGLAEVLPWVKQWHGEIDDAYGMSPADAYTGYLEDQQLKHGLTTEALTAWRPEKKTARGRKPKPKSSE
jgi:hypothetical protein